MALPVLRGPSEGEGLHRVHRPRELRGRDDQGSSVVLTLFILLMYLYFFLSQVPLSPAQNILF